MIVFQDCPTARLLKEMRIMKVKEIMNKEAITCDSEDAILTLIEKFKMQNISSMHVMKLEKVVGMISESTFGTNGR